MDKRLANRFSQAVSVFRERRLPADARVLAGYGALVHALDLAAPLPARLAVVSSRHRREDGPEWLVFTPRHQPEPTVAGHLAFALRYEGVDLLVLKRLFEAVPDRVVADLVRAEPTGRYSRRAWFLHEWLTGRTLDLPDATSGNYVEALDPGLQYPGPARDSRRHRVRDNLPGTREFCPLVRRTPELERFIRSGIGKEVARVVGAVHGDLMARAAAFLLLKDSKASFAIEGERPSRSRAERWGRAVALAGTAPLDREELLRLQQIVIEDDRFTKMGWRREGGFIGSHDRDSGDPLPDHVSARPGDLKSLVGGILDLEARLGPGDLDPVLKAAMVAFGFVFVHPFSDGNGRVHRYLIHHSLAAAGFTPRGLVFPVSAVILERVEEYRRALEDFSAPRQAFIDWRPTGKGNVEVTNDTADLYRYFDATAQAAFLYACVEDTARRVLPQEVAWLDRHDRMRSFVAQTVDMPDRTAELLIRFLRQGGGKLSKRARQGEFRKLTAGECQALERRYAEVFGADGREPPGSALIPVRRR